MGCMLRSDSMTQCEVFMQPETSFLILSRLGEEGCVQFTDLNEDLNLFQRTYVIEICRCAEMERKMRYIGEKMREDEIFIPKEVGEPLALELHELPAYEVTIDKWERVIVEMTANMSQLSKTYLQMSQMSYVLADVGAMLGDADLRHQSVLGAIKKTGKGKSALTAPVTETGGRLTVITGLVQRTRSYSFQVMLWRLSRGNAYYKQTVQDRIFKDPFMNNMDVRKVAFLLVAQGDALGERMKKVCEGFRCDLYPLPSTQSERLTALEKVIDKTSDLRKVLKETKFQRCKAMRSMSKSFSADLMRIKKAKAVYHTMNMCTLDITKNCLIGQVWIPDADVGRVQNIFRECSHKMETAVPSFLSKLDTMETPPTFHRTNRFTYAFQGLISAYGDSTYRELNPGLYTIVTFPFLFSLMFGDLGHGFIMFLTALWMVLNEKKFIAEKSDSEIWNIFFSGRYILLLMGLFSMYAGFLYNDCFSKSFTIWDSGWSSNKSLVELQTEESFLLEPKDHDRTYYIGKDPTWELAQNKILFDNSLKMKLSIIIGVIHMLFGLSLSYFNNTLSCQHVPVRHNTGTTFDRTTLDRLYNYSYKRVNMIKTVTHGITHLTNCNAAWRPRGQERGYYRNSGKYSAAEDETARSLYAFIPRSLPTRYFNKTYLVFLQFLPQVLFLVCIFFWLVILIIMKWIMYGGGSPASHKTGQGCAPLVLLLFIDMVLLTESKPNAPECDAYMFEPQNMLQKILLLVAVVSVPIMLFGPPCVTLQINKKKLKALMLKAPKKDEDPRNYAEWARKVEHYSEPFSDLMVHQAVHTIEFVLSTVSHTASYLRLWALSLAHAQLSEMLWAMVLEDLALKDHTNYGSARIVVIFAIWAVFTLAILVLMEGLSAFLHTLRLHWVEFMSKFFEGAGRIFKPFSFEALFSEAGKDKIEVCPDRKTFDF